MKKELLLSSLLLTAPISINANELGSVRASVHSFRQDIISKVFQSNSIVSLDIVRANNIERKNFYVRLSFMSARDYEFDGVDKLDMEVVIEYVSIEDNSTRLDDSSFFVKLINKKNKFSHYKIYDCDSSSFCKNSEFNTDFFIDHSTSTLTIKKAGIAIPMFEENQTVIFKKIILDE